MTSSPRKFLQYTQVLELFPLRLRNEIYARAQYKDFRRNVYIYKRGQSDPFIVGVMSGRLRMSISSREGKEMLVTMVEKGEMCGEMSVIDGEPRAMDLITEVDTTLMVIKGEDFLPILMQSPEAMLGMMRMDCYRRRLYVHTLELIALQNLSMRLSHYLLRLAHEYGVEQDGKIVISARLSQADIGHQLACSRESINKQLSSLADRGLLVLEGDDIILDVEALKKTGLPISA